MDIEGVAAKTPELLHSVRKFSLYFDSLQVPIDPEVGLPERVALDLAKKIGFSGEKADAAAKRTRYSPPTFRLFFRVYSALPNFLGS